MWLPGGKTVGEATRFYRPTPETTLTIPSTALSAISVAAYDSRRQSYADFSGRGYTRLPVQIKPDLAAPGVDIRAPRPGGGYPVRRSREPPLQHPLSAERQHF